MVVETFIERRAAQIETEKSRKKHVAKMQKLADDYRKPPKTKAELALED